VRQEAAAKAGAGEKQILLRAERLEWFLTQPFMTMAEATEKPGVAVALADTLAGCRAILGGQLDSASSNDLLYRGALG
jgi:F-type H+-transporting ATPase subunit beta